MNDRMTSYREKSDNSNMTKVLFGIGFGMSIFRIVQNNGE